MRRERESVRERERKLVRDLHVTLARKVSWSANLLSSSRMFSGYCSNTFKDWRRCDGTNKSGQDKTSRDRRERGRKEGRRRRRMDKEGGVEIKIEKIISIIRAVNQGDISNL